MSTLSSGRTVLDIRDYLPGIDNISDHGRHIQAAIDALPAGGGVVILSGGSYRLLTSPSFASRSNVTLWRMPGVSLTGPGALPVNAGSNSVVDMALAGGTPTGAAGGSLAGTYPNPTLATGAVSTTALAPGAATGAALGADVVTLTAAQTLASKTLTAPTISSFVSAQHDHATVVGGGLTKTPVATKTAAYTATDTDAVLLCNATTAAFTVTLPTAVGRAGQTFDVKKLDATVNAVTVDGAGAETIDGVATLAISGQNDSYTLVSDGAAWWIV